MSLRPASWMPLVFVAAGALILYGYVSANPLPWNGYGHTVFDVDGIWGLDPGVNVYFTLAGGDFLPRGSFVLATAGVITNQSNPDAPSSVYFQLTFAGATVADNYGVFSHSFETRVDAQASDRPQFLIRNDNPFHVEVDVHAFVIVAPSVWEHYSLFLPLLLVVTALAVLWAVYSTVLQRSPHT